jgi:hypothetical protein
MLARRYLPLVLVLCPLGCREHAVRPSFVLSPQEIRQARDLAEARLPAPKSSEERVYFVKVDLLPASQAESGQRRVMVHHYRYAGDETTFTLVDLRTLDVVSVETAEHYPTALAEEETARATGLARADERVRPFLDNGAELEFRPMQFAAEDPRHGRRVVQVLLRGRDGYFSRPRVLIDLGDDKVEIGE